MANIIITGAGKGIGFELAKMFCAEAGHQIVAISRNITALTDFEIEKNEATLCCSGLRPFQFDLVRDDLKDLEKFVRLHFNQVDILINNAGTLVNKPFTEINRDDFDHVVDTNFKAVFFTTQHFLPMMHQGSHIINIGSMGGFQGSVKFPGLSLYSASKAALASLTECLALELKDRQIAVNCLALGAAQTEMLSQAFPGYEAPVTAFEMAGFIKNFALTAGQFISGKVIPVSVSTP
jgi:NAD(P)-dependent dehydrogenase (short-subunit alcohol dehydrogenase family)